VIEAAERRHAGIERGFAGMAKGGVAQVVRQGQRLGQIIVIQKLAKSPLHAEILLKPLVNFDTLREVMVVTGQQAPVAQLKPKPAVKPILQPVKNDRPKQTVKPAG